VNLPKSTIPPKKDPLGAGITARLFRNFNLIFRNMWLIPPKDMAYSQTQSSALLTHIRLSAQIVYDFPAGLRYLTIFREYKKKLKERELIVADALPNLLMRKSSSLEFLLRGVQDIS
jgi:hypothetical protein